MSTLTSSKRNNGRRRCECSVGSIGPVTTNKTYYWPEINLIQGDCETTRNTTPPERSVEDSFLITEEEANSLDPLFSLTTPSSPQRE
jgi:hypothetical protein